MKVIAQGIPRLALVANRDIQEGEELSYDISIRCSLLLNDVTLVCGTTE